MRREDLLVERDSIRIRISLAEDQGKDISELLEALASIEHALVSLPASFAPATAQKRSRPRVY